MADNNSIRVESTEVKRWIEVLGTRKGQLKDAYNSDSEALDLLISNIRTDDVSKILRNYKESYDNIQSTLYENLETLRTNLQNLINTNTETNANTNLDLSGAIKSLEEIDIQNNNSSGA